MIKDLPKKIALGLLAIGITSIAHSQTWESIDTPVSSNLILQDISFPDDQSEIGYTGGTNVTYNGKGKVLKTTDGGDTWVVQWESEVNGTGVTSLHFFTTSHGFAGTMAGNLMETVDGGTTWTSVDIDPNENQGEITDLDFYDSDNGAMVTQWGGIYITDDGGATWTVASTNYMTSIDLFYASETTLFAAGFSQEIYKSTDGGDTWEFSYQGPNGAIDQYVNLGVFFIDANNGIVTSEEGNYFQTSDGGDTWEEGSVTGQFGLMRGIYMFDIDNYYICATPGEVFSTTDGGSDWTSEYYDYDPSFYKILFTSDGTGFVCGSSSTGGTILKQEPTGVGISENERISLNVFPNPANNKLNVQLDLDQASVLTFSFTSMDGRLVMEEQLQIAQGNINKVLDVSTLSEGSYILSIKDKQEMIAVKQIQILK